KAEMAFLRDSHPEMYAYLDQLAKPPPPLQPVPTTRPAPIARRQTTQPAAVAGAAVAGAGAGAGQRFRQGAASNEPFYNAVFDAGLWVNGSDPDLTMLDVKPG